MVKATELRIGNLILQKCTNQYRKVDHYDIANLALQDSDIRRKVEANDLAPIPLTPEILEKVKLKPYCFGGYGIDIYNGEVSVAEQHLPHIKYLHQLQNLYFALTGEELPISEQALEVCDATKAQ